MKRLMAAALSGLAMVGGVHAQSDQMIQTFSPDVLTREDAIKRALLDDPHVASTVQRIRAEEATARQAGLRPNPTLDVELENFGGTGVLSGVGRSEATYVLSQPVELGGDRKARRLAADRETDTARIQAGLSRLDVREAVELAFVEAQMTEALAKVAQSRLEIVQEFAEAVDLRVRSARDPEPARTRVASRLAEAEARVLTTKARAAAVKAALGSYWGGGIDFTIEMASFFDPVWRDFDDRESPDLALAEAERKSAAARVDVERAKRIPDIKVRAGVKQVQSTNDVAFVVGISVPLPFWNRNSGAIAAAHANRKYADYAVAARERELARDIANLNAQAEMARVEIKAYEEEVIPGSEKALAQSFQIYQQGGLSYIEVLDAQASLNDARLQHISSLYKYHRAEAKLARLRGALPDSNFQEAVQ